MWVLQGLTLNVQCVICNAHARVTSVDWYFLCNINSIHSLRKKIFDKTRWKRVGFCEVKTPFCHHTFLLYVFASSFSPAKKHNLLPSSLQICAHTHTLTAPTLTPTPCQRRLQIDCFRMSLGRRETKLSVLLFPLRRPASCAFDVLEIILPFA